MQREENSIQNQKASFAPVISVLGHVDHGKTSLLDKIRQTSIAAREKGGITQKIGASQIEILHEGIKRKITFIDTPGHEAFSSMRAQGVDAADIVLLVVAADDGIKPQTKESIEKILEAKLPFIVVITKIDVPGANIEKVKQQLLSENIPLEGLGGSVSYVGVSSKTGEHIKDLLDLIILTYDLSSIEKNDKDDFLGVVIDSKLDKRKGSVASIVVKAGMLVFGEKIYAGSDEVGKVRALFDTFEKGVKRAIPGEAVEILGLNEVLNAGSIIKTKKESAPILEERAKSANPQITDIADFFNEEKKENVLVILKSDSSGELEAVKESLPKNIEIAYAGQGEIGVSDILLAKDLKALVVGFNVSISKEAKILAESEKVFFKIYGIIYELLDELSDLIAAIKAEGVEKVLGRGKVLERFSGTSGEIIGTKVTEGRFAIKDKIRIMRKDEEIGEALIVSIRKGKSDVKQVIKNDECGIIISSEVDFRQGDDIISYK